MSVQITNERYGQLKHIAALGLAVYDTILYLDTNDCPEAAQYLEKRKAEYKDAVSHFEEKYGPIYLYGHPSEDVLWAWQIV